MAIKSELAELLKKFKPLTKEYRNDERVKDVYKGLSLIVDQLADEEEPKTLVDLFKVRKEQRGLTGQKVPTAWLAQSMEYFTALELGALIGTSKENIFGRIKHAKQSKGKIGGSLGSFGSGKRLSEMDPLVVYIEALELLYRIANSDDPDIKNADKLKAVETVLRYGEAEVMRKLKEKFETLDGLGNFIITTLIPQANKRIRELIRELETKIRSGEDTSYVTIDLRTILKELLPTIPGLKEKVVSQKWIADDNA